MLTQNKLAALLACAFGEKPIDFWISLSKKQQTAWRLALKDLPIPEDIANIISIDQKSDDPDRAWD